MEPRHAAALHEAGHAILGMLHGIVPSLVTLDPKDRPEEWASEAAGLTVFDEAALNAAPIGIRALITVAGDVAEQLATGESREAIHDAFKVERLFFVAHGLDAEALAEPDDHLAERFELWLSRIRRRAARQLAKPAVRHAHVALAEALERRGTLRRRDIERAICCASGWATTAALR